MSAERWVAVALMIVSGALVLRLAPGAVRSWRVYRGTGSRRQEDAGPTAPAAPPGVSDRLSLLAAEGYQQLGVTRLRLPGGDRFAWIAGADDGESYAILAGAFGRVPLTGFYSAWQDGTWLATLHPVGQATDRPNLTVRVVATTLADAVSVHRDGLRRLATVHGPPRSISSMSDLLALDADYRLRFGGSRLRPITMRIVLPAVGAVIVFGLAVWLFVLSGT